MLINKANMTGMFTAFKAMASASAASAKKVDIVGLGLVLDMPVTQVSVDYSQLQDISDMREWVGEREIKRQKGQKLVISCVEYERTVEVKKRDIESDALGLIQANVRQMAANSALKPQKMFASFLENASTTLSIDGQYLLDTDHEGSAGSSQSNVSSNTFTYDNLVTADVAMMNFTNTDGDKVGAKGTHLVVGPANLHAARRFVESENIPGSGNNDTNTLEGAFEIVLIPELGSKWFLIDAGKEYKAAVWQHRKLPEFAAVTDMDDSYVFLNNAYLFGTDADWVVGPGVWQAIYGGGF